MYSMYSQMTLTMKSNISLSVINNYSIYYIHAHDTGVKILYNSPSLAVQKKVKMGNSGSNSIFSPRMG